MRRIAHERTGPRTTFAEVIHVKLVRSMQLGIVTTLLFSSACGGTEDETQRHEEEEASSAITPEARAEAAQIFSTRCAVCHGAQGMGDGPGSAGLNPHPRNFTDAAWQDSVEDSYLERIIQYGGAAVGKSAAMPSNPDLGSRPAVLAALREHVRSLRR